MQMTSTQLYILSNKKINETLISKLGGIKTIKQKLGYIPKNIKCRKYYSILDIKTIDKITKKEKQEIYKIMKKGKQLTYQNLLKHNKNKKFNILPINENIDKYFLGKISLYLGHLDNLRKYLGENVQKSKNNILNRNYKNNKK